MDANILVLAGDGIGPEVTRQAVRALTTVAERYDHHFEFDEQLIGGVALTRVGHPFPDATVTACAQADAVLLGAVGDPKFDRPGQSLRPETGLLELRRHLGVFANLRPVTPHPAGARVSPLRAERLRGVDLLFVRELTGGIYFGQKSRSRDSATDECRYTSEEIERVVRMAARLAQERRGKLTSIDKANVLETSRLWREVVTRVVAEEFRELALEHLLVDAAAMHLLQRPADFDVIVTENMFGDILTDEAAVLAGSIGLLPSASLGDTSRGLYEPIHGSAPAMAGRDVANPVGAILSAALLLRHSLGLHAEALAIENAVMGVLDAEFLTADLAVTGTTAVSTSSFGEAVVTRLLQQEVYA